MHETAAVDAPDIPPPPPADASPDEAEAYWYKHVYRGDSMPQLTLRAVVMGGLLGMLMASANLYTTLSIGWSFGVAITSCVMSYVIWNLLRVLSGYALSRAAALLIVAGAAVYSAFWLLPSARAFIASTPYAPFADLGAWGACVLVVVAALGLAALLWRTLTPMTILENNCMQSTASAAGYSTGSTIATAFGALLILEGHHLGPWVVGSFTLVTAAMGVFLAVPMKRQMINQERLPFPSGIAAAETLKSLYSHGIEATHKAYALIGAMFIGIIVGILNTAEETLTKLDQLTHWLKDRLFDVRLPELVPATGLFKIGGRQLIGFGFEPSVLLIGAGMIVGVRVSLSMLLGSILLYFVVAPQLIAMDAANADVEKYVRSVDLVAGGTIYHVFRWGLWGGTAVMVFSSLTALALNWRTIARSFTLFKGGEQHTAAAELEARRRQIEVPTAWLILGMLPIMIAMLLVQALAFNINVYLGLVAVAMSFVLSLVASRATGETDTTPIGAMGKVMQLLFAALSPKDITHNLISAGVAANSASSSADLLTDLKSGYLLGANPRRQFIAQFLGIFFGTLAIVPAWYLMVPNVEALQKFPAPATNQWLAVARVLTQGLDQLAYSAKIAILVGAAVGIVLPIIERMLPKARPFLPSAMGLGLSWVLPFANPLSFMIGALIAWVWSRMHGKSQGVFNVPIASGLVAGESLCKAAIAMSATVERLTK